MTEEEFSIMQEKALEQLKTGKSLTGPDGVFAPLLKQFLEAALEAEMEVHLDEEENSKQNKRNGKILTRQSLIYTTIANAKIVLFIVYFYLNKYSICFNSSLSLYFA